jgi:hypothetical protein
VEDGKMMPSPVIKLIPGPDLAQLGESAIAKQLLGSFLKLSSTLRHLPNQDPFSLSSTDT